MAQREPIYIKDREFAASKIPAFAANGIILKLQKLVLPVIGEVAGGGKDVMNMDVSAAFQIISEKLDDSVMTDIVLPMFKLAQVASITDNCKIDSAQAIDKVFQDADGLADIRGTSAEFWKFFQAAGGALWKQRWRPAGDGIDPNRVGSLSDELSNELWIWRPILAGKCTLEGVLSGLVDIDNIMKLNALLDMSTAMEQYSQFMAEKKSR